jgi:putative SOS response-associated peptidase YedK
MYITFKDGEQALVESRWRLIPHWAKDRSITSRMFNLDAEAVELWLYAELTNPADVLPVLGPCKDGILTAYPVAPLVNNVCNDWPELIERVEDED